MAAGLLTGTIIMMVIFASLVVVAKRHGLLEESRPD